MFFYSDPSTYVYKTSTYEAAGVGYLVTSKTPHMKPPICPLLGRTFLQDNHVQQAAKIGPSSVKAIFDAKTTLGSCLLYQLPPLSLILTASAIEFTH